MRLGERFREALLFAAELHEGQVRKGTTTPYISHLLAVAALVLEAGGDEEEAIAALLHDGPEDRGGRRTLERIRERFGDRVAAIVEGCSDTLETPKPPWRPRKEAYIAHLRGHADRSQRLVSLCDKLHNLRAILADYRRVGESLWDRFRAGREEILWYHRSLLEVYRASGDKLPPLDEFARTLGELEREIG
jgi:GTP pyrophosphokinase